MKKPGGAEAGGLIILGGAYFHQISTNKGVLFTLGNFFPGRVIQRGEFALAN